MTELLLAMQILSLTFAYCMRVGAQGQSTCVEVTGLSAGAGSLFLLCSWRDGTQGP